MALQFEDLNIRKQSKELTILVFKVFEKNNNYSFKDQIQRACVSVMNNIAEGYDRESELDRKRFFVMAKWSCAEVRSMLYLCLELWYLDWDQYKELLDMSISISKMIFGLVKKMNW